MNLKQVFGMFLLLAGMGAFIYCLSIRDSFEYKFVSAFGGDTSRVGLLMIGGIIASVTGVLLMVFGRNEESGEEHPVRPVGQPQQNEDTLEVQQFDDEKLEQIAESCGLYRPEIVEASRRELELRHKCKELLPQVREKDDEQLREITGNPTLYTEELIRTARMVQDERRRLRLQEQERAEQAARLEREKQAEERRQRRIAARKKRRPYVLVVLALLVLAGAGTGYYAYRQKQERLAMERRAAEERRIAQEKKAAEERAAQERWAEERRLEEEKQRREAAEQGNALAQSTLERLQKDNFFNNLKITGNINKEIDCDGIYHGPDWDYDYSKKYLYIEPKQFDRYHFGISLEFYPRAATCLLSLSSDYRVLNIELRDGIIFIKTNNGRHIYNTGIKYDIVRWNKLDIRYHYGTIYINDKKIDNVQMNMSDGNNSISSINFSSGNVFNGKIRNIKVYN